MLRILGIPFSPHTRKVLVAAHYKKIKFEIVRTSPIAPPAGFRELSPLGTVPVLQDGNMTLADSSVIALYLERIKPAPSLYPQDSKAYGRALWIEEYVDSSLTPHIFRGLFLQCVLGPKKPGFVADKDLVRETVDVCIPAALQYLEGALDADYFAGGQFSYADITVASALLNLHYCGESVNSDRYPKLRGFLRQILREAAFRCALEGEAPAVRSFGGMNVSLLDELGY